ncbi:MAG: adenylate/guanylate cyclase domain-containing protein [Solirubrobacteraceae bacterium]
MVRGRGRTAGGGGADHRTRDGPPARPRLGRAPSSHPGPRVKDPVELRVNTAARVEAATRGTDDRVLITEDTRRLLRTGAFELDERKTVELKGKQVHVELWAPRAHPVDASDRDRAGASVPH